MKKYKLCQLTLILAPLLLIFFLGCISTPKLSGGFHSIEELAGHAIGALLGGDREKFMAALVTKQEFIQSIHPYTPEAKSLSGEDKWRIFTGTRRRAGISKKFHAFEEEQSKLEFEGIGQPRTTLEYGDLKLHRRIPVYFKRINSGTVRQCLN